MLAASGLIDSRFELLQRLQIARRQTDELFQRVRPDSLYARPIPERHRIVFYIGHLEAFDWNLLQERLLRQKSFHPEFDRLFAFGIDPVDGGLPDDQPSDWPPIAKVREYVERVRQVLDTDLVRSGRADERNEFSPNLLLNVAIEHRLMHAETLSYMLHQLPLDAKVVPAQSPQLISRPVEPSMVEIPGGSVRLGLRRDDDAFGWDNEYEAHDLDVPAFAIDKYKVTNRQYLEFLNAGGYEQSSLWTGPDWEWRLQHNITHPVFWKSAGQDWKYLTIFDEVPLPLDWPVYVSHAEASAYACWAGKSLPTEAQWQRAAYGSSANPNGGWSQEQNPPQQLGNFDFQHWDPTPVGAYPQGESAFGVADMFGNGWEWTSTVFAPFPGFNPFSFYPGYSANFFDGQHYVMKGGSARTAACMMRPSFRNWFQAHYQYVYSGFRCVSN
jgi:ergothioneine biosynthesis protein EgtB